MRILMISDVYFPRVNGVSTSINTFITEFRKAGHEVTLIAPAYDEQTTTSVELDDNIIRIPSRKVMFDPEDRMMNRDHVRKLLAGLAHQQFDIIHVQTPFVAHYLGTWLAARLGIPCIETYHTFFEEYLFHYLPLAPRFLMRALARYFTVRQCNDVDRVIVPSTAMRDVLLGYGVRTPQSVLPTGIPLQNFGNGDRQRFRHKYAIDASRPVISTVGRVAFEKNLDFLLDVLACIQARLPDILLIIAGEGPMVPHLKKRVKKMHLEANVLFVGYMDRATELHDCYCSTDVFVFASRTETQGLVLLEAMAEGVPVVSTAVMGTKDVLREGQGCLIAEEHCGEFASKVVELLNDPDRRAALSVSARHYVKLWTADLFAEKLAALYQELATDSTAVAETEELQTKIV